MAQRTLAAGFTDTGIEKAAAKSAPAGKKKPRNPRLNIIEFSEFSVPSVAKNKLVQIRVYSWLIFVLFRA
jgi:hypothetical protein